MNDEHLMLKPGDVVEIVCPSIEIDECLNLKPGHRGVVMGYDGLQTQWVRHHHQLRMQVIESYTVNFHGKEAHCVPACLRKVTDDGRAVVQWDWHRLTQVRS
jgi:hypothetical protein